MKAWLRGGIVAIVAILALFFAAHGGEGFGPYLWMLIFIVAVLVLFRLIARAFDPPGEKSPFVPVPRSQPARLWLTGVLAIAGIVCLFVAAGAGAGGSYYIGLMLAAALWLYVFRLIGASVGR